MTDKEWAQQKRWEKSPATKLYREAERARLAEADLLGALDVVLDISPRDCPWGCEGFHRDTCAVARAWRVLVKHGGGR